jgi:hypothetical protein
MSENENFTTEKKAEKFDELMAECGKLVTYKHNLSTTLISNVESMIDEQQDKEIDQQIDSKSLRGIQWEIARVNDLISFIYNTVYGDKNSTFESKINPSQDL